MFQGIYFDDNSIYIKAEPMPFLVPEEYKILHLRKRLAEFGMFRDFETHRFCRLEQFPVGFGCVFLSYELIQHR